MLPAASCPIDEIITDTMKTALGVGIKCLFHITRNLANCLFRCSHTHTQTHTHTHTHARTHTRIHTYTLCRQTAYYTTLHHTILTHSPCARHLPSQDCLWSHLDRGNGVKWRKVQTIQCWFQTLFYPRQCNNMIWSLLISSKSAGCLCFVCVESRNSQVLQS